MISIHPIPINALFLFGGTSADDNVVGSMANNTINGYAGNDYLWGDNSGTVSSGLCGADTISGGAGNDTLYGDAKSLAGTAVGGNDTLYADSSSGSGVGGCSDHLFGDAYDMTGAANTARGGDDKLYDYSINANSELDGDAWYMGTQAGTSHASGGN